MATDGKAMLRRIFEEGMNQRNMAVFGEVMAPDFKNPDLPIDAKGPDGFRQNFELFSNAFPDLQVNIEEVLSDGDKVVSRGIWRGTHQGDFMGIAPTGKQVAVQFIDIWRIENGKFAEAWVRMDVMGLTQQLGVAPST